MSAAKCPICDKPATPEHRPFCSARCADVDLHRWLAGRYAVPGSEAVDEVDPPDDED
jgi:endogenous inhibitor of DNA gyrase (YacG/DUF329 family)